MRQTIFTQAQPHQRQLSALGRLTSAVALGRLTTLAAAALMCMAVALPTSADAAPKKKRKAKPAVSKAVQSDVRPYGERAEAMSFVQDMVTKHGFVKEELQFLLTRVRQDPDVIRLMTVPYNPNATGPLRRSSWVAHRGRFVEPVRLNAGVRFWNQHAAALDRAEKQYGVPAYIIIGILGVETVYGRVTGNFRVVDALATLAFDYPKVNKNNRSDFFRSELENYLLFARDQGVDVFSTLGSYAGAIGLPQFMPSNYRTLAVDYDSDGKIDLRNSPVDAIGSVANYLKFHGWRAGEPVVLDARTKGDVSAFFDGGLDAKFTPAQLAVVADCVGKECEQLKTSSVKVGLIDLHEPPDQINYKIATENFFAITKYNRSYYYAMSVYELGRAVQQARSTGVIPSTPAAPAASGVSAQGKSGTPAAAFAGAQSNGQAQPSSQ